MSMYNKRASYFNYTCPSRYFISALNGRLCQKDICKDCWNGKPQPSILNEEK